MGYRLVEGEGLRTRFAATPTFVVVPVPDGPLALEVAFQAEQGNAGSESAFTRLRFEDVREYRWVAIDQTYFSSNRDDFEFGLIEIIDSGQVKQMLDAGLYADQPVGQRLGGTISEAALRHYRIGFEEYGTFDVVCLGLRINRFRAIS